jgi:hypothetical protein
MKMGNFFVKGILNSPLHPLMSASTAVISGTGRKSGRIYSIPVNYELEGNEVTITSARDRTWWKNLRGGSEVRLYIKGERYSAQAVAIEDDDIVGAYLDALLLRQPNMARFYGVNKEADGSLWRADLKRAASERVLIKVALSDSVT